MGDAHAELRDKIEAMSPNQQVEVLRILSEVTPSIPLNENSNGTFVNLTALDSPVLAKLRAYATYVDEQQTHLSIAEKEMERLGNTYFNGNKECNDT